MGLESTLSLNIQTKEKVGWTPQSYDYSVVYINRPYEKIAPINLSPLSVKEIRLVALKRNESFVTFMFHLRLVDADDLVISYQNCLTDFKKSKIKTVTGGYRLKPFAYNYKQVLCDYTTNSNISLESYGLKLSVAQKNMLIRQLVQDYWFYDRAYNPIYSNGAMATCHSLDAAFESSFPVFVSHFIPATYFSYLKRTNKLNLDDVIVAQNLKESKDSLAQKNVELFETQKELQRRLLNKCSHLDIPFDLGFSKFELIETIRDKFELNRNGLIGGTKDYTRQSELNLASYAKARIWLGTVIGSDETLMRLQSKSQSLREEILL